MSTELLKLLQKDFKPIVMTADKVPPLTRVSSGIATLDAILGGGLPEGRILELYGLESGGKSSISLSIANAMVKQGYSVLYEDLERTVTQDSININDLNTPLFIYSRPIYGEEGIDLAIKAAEGGAKLIIIDTGAMLTPRSVYDKFEADSEGREIGGQAGMMNRLKSKITNHIEQAGAILLIVNQIRDNQGPHGGTTTPGGHAVKHMFSVRIQITHTVKDQKVPGRIQSQIKIVKSKISTPGLSCVIPILNGVVQRTEALVLTAESLGVIIKAGAWFYLAGYLTSSGNKEGIGQGQARVAAALDSNPELYELVKNAVAAKMQIELEGLPEEDEDNDA